MDRNILCNSKCSIMQALEKININKKGCVFLIDDNEMLLGVITDGDIRRGLLSGFTLQSSIGEIERRNYVYAREEESVKDIFSKFSDTIRVIPIVDKNYHVVDYSEYKKEMKLPIAQPLLNGKEMEYLLDAFLSTWISSTGKYVTDFEKCFSQYCDMEYGIATSNGTTALHLALIALGIGEGDEVIIPDITFAATINAVLYTGATPVIVDIEEDSWCIDPMEIEKAITNKTKAIIPVHIYGQPCDMDSIMYIAKKYSLYIVEDCAEAHGAKYDGKKVGSFGDIGCFSFFGNKVITTGEGGMCITNCEEFEKKMRLYRDHGMSREKKYYHEVVGYNYRMTNLQAAIGVAQLENIQVTLQWRQNLEEMYRKKLAELKTIRMQQNNLRKREKITWLVTVYTEERMRSLYMDALSAANIEVRPFFIPLSEMKIYRSYVFSNKISRQMAKCGFNLPTSHLVNETEINRIIEIMRTVENDGGK